MNAEQLREAAVLQEELTYIDKMVGDIVERKDDEVFMTFMDCQGDASQFITQAEPLRLSKDAALLMLENLRESHVARLQALGVEL